MKNVEAKVMQAAQAAFEAKQKWAEGWGNRKVAPFETFVKAAWVEHEASEARKAIEAAEEAKLAKLAAKGILVNGALTYQVINGRAKWTHAFGNYNDRRMGRPWGSNVEVRCGNVDLNFSGQYDVESHNTNAGTLTVWAGVGEAVAVGQRDSRGTNYLAYFMVINGAVKEVSKAVLRNPVAVEPASKPKLTTKGDIMRRAWVIAREVAAAHGGGAKSALSMALKQAWAEFHAQ
jgi:hypothetical protein